MFTFEIPGGIAQGRDKYRDLCSISALLFSSSIPDSHFVFSEYMGWCSDVQLSLHKCFYINYLTRFFRGLHQEVNFSFHSLFFLSPSVLPCTCCQKEPCALEMLLTPYADWKSHVCCCVVPAPGSKPDLKKSLLAQSLCHASCVHTAFGPVGYKTRANVVFLACRERNLRLCEICCEDGL